MYSIVENSPITKTGPYFEQIELVTLVQCTRRAPWRWSRPIVTRITSKQHVSTLCVHDSMIYRFYHFLHVYHSEALELVLKMVKTPQCSPAYATFLLPLIKRRITDGGGESAACARKKCRRREVAPVVQSYFLQPGKFSFNVFIYLWVFLDISTHYLQPTLNI